MNEAGFVQLLFVRAAEECDPEGRMLPLAARERAGREVGGPPAGDSAGAQADWLAARAARLAEPLDRDHPGLARARRLASRQLPATPLVIGGFVLGFLADALGSGREVNLLAVPLLGILAWNAVVLLGGPLLRLAGGSSAGWLASVVRHGVLAQAGRGSAGDARRWVRRVLSRTLELLAERAGALLAARARLRLHLAGAAFAAGIVASLYAAGFAFEYRATWESTFLEAEGAARVLAAVLGPASALLGLETPDVPELAALRAPATGEAAPWIHRWALTLALFVILPRLALATWEAGRARGLARGLGPDLESAWALRLLASVRGGGERVDVLPYSAAPTPTVADRLRDLCLELFGSRAEIVLADGLAYGDDPPDEGLAGHCVVVFDLAQTPESEVHGRFLRQCQSRVEQHPGRRMLVLLEESRFRAKAGDDRGDERRRSWVRLLRSLELEPATLPEPRAGGEALEAARDALWPVAA